ncbi:Inosine-5'-monophosphate dehydrogenase [Streptomyces sp. enrichment culture]|uniref:CBS domain-containing protein n=1 Tax=Streptomyces sp. enrichment culture TaxID=1795815 RepID=UPI003F55B754
MDQPVVVGVDGSEASLRAVDWSADEAALRGVPLHVVSRTVGEPGRGRHEARGDRRGPGGDTMQHDKVGSVMTMDVVRAVYDTSFEEVARLQADHRIGQLPVVDDDDRVIGVVSASDLVAHRAVAPGPHRTRRRFGLPAPSPAARRRATAATVPTAGRLMSAPPFTAHAEDTIVEAARTMARLGVKRMPVLDEKDRLVGLVTRRDLLRVFLRPDADIRDEMIDEVLVRVLWLTPRSIDVSVTEAVVTLTGPLDRWTAGPLDRWTAGPLDRRSETEIAVAMARRTDGVVAVVDELTWRLDDTRLRPDGQLLHGVADDRLRNL